MAIRVTHNVLVQISGDASGKDKRYYPESQITVMDGFDRSATKDINIPAATNEAMNLADITLVKGVYLELDGDVGLQLNGNPAIPLKRNSLATGTKVRFFIEADINAISIDNTAGASAVNGVLVLWGDPTV